MPYMVYHYAVLRIVSEGAERMKIAIAADHGGFELKSRMIKYYEKQGLVLTDLGTYSQDSVDYPDIAAAMAKNILDGAADLGILICGTGIGISIAANRHKGIRAAILYSDDAARLAREHNNANIAVFGGRTMTFEEAVRRFDIFLSAKYEGGRHDRRLCKLDID